MLYTSTGLRLASLFLGTRIAMRIARLSLFLLSSLRPVFISLHRARSRVSRGSRWRLEHRRDNLVRSPPSKRSRCFHPFPLSLATRDETRTVHTGRRGISQSPSPAQRHTWRHGSRARSTWPSRGTLGLGLGLPRLIPRRVALVATMPSISAGTLCTGAQPATPPGRMARCSLPEHTHPP